jgi:acetyl-CoA carboxylase biotin carboxyl carrier protein
MAENTASAKADDAKSTRKAAVIKAPDELSLNMDELRELMELVNEKGFTEFEFENESIRVRLSKFSGVPGSIAPLQQNVSQSSAAGPSGTASPEGEAPAATTEADEELHRIVSPIVGTFFRSPGPDKEPYVKEGSKVSPESVVCIVEAMKLMNEIQAEVSGEVVKIYVENGQPVEFGQPLFGIRK